MYPSWYLSKIYLFFILMPFANATRRNSQSFCMAFVRNIFTRKICISFLIVRGSYSVKLPKLPIVWTEFLINVLWAVNKGRDVDSLLQNWRNLKTSRKTWPFYLLCQFTNKNEYELEFFFFNPFGMVFQAHMDIK